MFRITQDPSSGSGNLYLTEITHNGSNVLIMCMVGLWRHIVDLWCVCVRCVGLRTTVVLSPTQRTHTHNDAPQSVGLLWTSDQSFEETST